MSDEREFSFQSNNEGDTVATTVPLESEDNEQTLVPSNERTPSAEVSCNIHHMTDDFSTQGNNPDEEKCSETVNQCTNRVLCEWPQRNVCVEMHGATMENDINRSSESTPGTNEGKSSEKCKQQEYCSVETVAEESASVCIEMSELIEATSGEVSQTKSPSQQRTCLSTCSDGENTDQESDVCRICHCCEDTEVLISPCLCTGSVKYVHHSCLMNWLQRVVMSKCELCLYPLAVKRTRKSFRKWRLPEDKPFPILWLFTFVVAMTLNVASIAKDGSQRCVSNPCIIFYVLGSAGALLGLAFFYHWLRKTIRYLAKWIALNEEWTLVGPTDLRSQIGQTNLAFSTKSLPDVDSTQVEVA